MLSLDKFLAKISQLGWLGTSTSSLSSTLLELGIEWIIVQDGSWIKITLKKNQVSRIVLIIKLFFHTFYEKILISLVIMSCYHSCLNELTVSCFYRAFDISLSTTLCWSSVFRMNTHLNWPNDHLCSWHTWMCEDKALLPWFLVRAD